MARFLSLKFGCEGAGLIAAAGLSVAGCFSSLRAEDSMQMQVQGKPVYPNVASPASASDPTAAKTPGATNAAPEGPLKPQDSLSRYGKVLIPGDDVAHPLKLKLPLPGAGEVKVPTPDELSMREKLEQLAKLSDDEIHLQLEQWPAYSKMNLRDQAQMLARIQDFRDYRWRVAMQKAHDLGLLTLTPDQKAKFEKEFWDKRIRMDHDLVKQLGPIFGRAQQKMEDELFREFSTASGPIALGPKPQVPPAAPTNQSPAPKAPVATDAKK